MTSLQWGSVPDWLQAAGTLGAVFYAHVAAARSNSLAVWPRLVEEISGLDAATIQRTLEEKPEVTQLVAAAWEEAGRTAVEEKLRLFAKVAAQALNATSDEELEQVPVLHRTVTALDPPHIKLLMLIALPAPRTGQFVGHRFEGYPTVLDLVAVWPGAQALLRPLIAVLNREALIEDQAGGTVPGGCWGLTDYGRIFLDLLDAPSEWQRRRHNSELVVRLDGPDGEALLVRNLGPADADHITLRFHEPPLWGDGDGERVSQDAASFLEEGPIMFNLTVNEERSLKFKSDSWSPSGGILLVKVSWIDGRGNRSDVKVLGSLSSNGLPWNPDLSWPPDP